MKLGKIKPYIEKVMADYQNGFTDGRSVNDTIQGGSNMTGTDLCVNKCKQSRSYLNHLVFALKIISEKIWEYNQNLQHLCIDFQMGCDSTQRDMLWKCMKEFKIPTKLINMYKTCVQKTRSAVRIEGTLSSFFENKTVLK